MNNNEIDEFKVFMKERIGTIEKPESGLDFAICKDLLLHGLMNKYDQLTLAYAVFKAGYYFHEFELNKLKNMEKY